MQAGRLPGEKHVLFRRRDAIGDSAWEWARPIEPPMTFAGIRTGSVVPSVAAALAGLALIGSLASSEVGWGLRSVTALAVGLAAVQPALSGPIRNWLSPALILALSATTFYSLLPALAVAHAAFFTIPQAHVDHAAPFLGSAAESLLLQFSAVMILIHWASTRWSEEPAGAESAVWMPRSGAVPAIALAACAAALGATRLSDLQPVTAALLAVLTAASFGAKRRDRMIAAVVIPAALAVLFVSGSGKIPAFMGLAVGLLAAGTYNRPAALLVPAAVLMIGMPLAVLTSRLQIWSQYGQPILPFEEMVRFVVIGAFRAKLITRQIDTDYCLANVVSRHLDQSGGEVFYFLKGLVPRFLWPDKPSLSLGYHYALEYCGYSADQIQPAGRMGSGQSSSITLLGQPLIQGGRWGLAVAVATLSLLLWGAVRGARRAGPAGWAALAAAMPWLIDFDQDFGLYVANAVRSGLIIITVVWLCRIIGSGGRRSKP